MKKVIVFDLDDTLFPEKEFVKSGFDAVSNWLEINYNIKNFNLILYQLFENGVRGNTFNLAMEKIKGPTESKFIHNLINVYRNHKPNINLFPDGKWALDYYQSQFRLGLLTDGCSITQKNKVSALGIEKYFGVIIYTDDLGKNNWKPSRVPYEVLEKKMFDLKNQYIYIADNISKDFIAPKELGWLTVHIQREKGEYMNIVADESEKADYQIKSLFDLKSILK